MTIENAGIPPDNNEHPSPDSQTVLNAVRQALAQLWRILAGDGESPLDDLRAAIGHLNPLRLVWGFLSLAIIGYLLTGVYMVAPGEAAVVRRFGEVIEPRADPGLHYRLPWPIDRVDIINISEVRRETVGIPEPEEDHVHPEPPSKLQVLSGDTNVVDFEIIVQYQIGDPAAYLLNVQYAPYRLVRDAIRQSATTLVTTQLVDEILTTERQALQDAIRTEAQARLDAYNSGLIIAGVNLQKAFPPDEVAEAFIDVNSAREDKVRSFNEATGYANSLIPEARGEAQKILSAADAYRSDALARANGAAQAFDSLLAEYRVNSQIYGEEITRYRLYLEVIEEILSRVQVYAVDTDNGGLLNLRLFGNPVLETTSP